MALGLFKKGIKAPSVPVALPSPTADDTFGTTDKKRAEGVDGRSLRATGRTEQFATKVSAGFKDRMKKAARKRGIGQNALLEDMLTVWEAQQPPGTADAESRNARERGGVDGKGARPSWPSTRSITHARRRRSPPVASAIVVERLSPGVTATAAP